VIAAAIADQLAGLPPDARIVLEQTITDHAGRLDRGPHLVGKVAGSGIRLVDTAATREARALLDLGVLDIEVDRRAGVVRLVGG
jgi:hypothetical protein